MLITPWNHSEIKKYLISPWKLFLFRHLNLHHFYALALIVPQECMRCVWSTESKLNFFLLVFVRDAQRFFLPVCFWRVFKIFLLFWKISKDFQVLISNDEKCARVPHICRVLSHLVLYFVIFKVEFVCSCDGAPGFSSFPQHLSQ